MPLLMVSTTDNHVTWFPHVSLAAKHASMSGRTCMSSRVHAQIHAPPHAFILVTRTQTSAMLQGMVTLALSTWIPGLQPAHEGDTANWLQNLALYGSLYIVALGTGGIKPNVSAFGADQFDMSDAKVSAFSCSSGCGLAC